MTITVGKVSKYGVFSGLYFPLFGLNMGIYSVDLRIQSEYRKIRTRKNSVFGHFTQCIKEIIFTPQHLFLQFFRKTTFLKIVNQVPANVPFLYALNNGL